MAPANLLLCFFNSRMYTFQYNKCFPVVLQIVSHLKSQFLIVSQNRGVPCVCFKPTQSKRCKRLGSHGFPFLFSKLTQVRTGFPGTVSYLQRKQTWLSYKRLSYFVNEVMGHWASSPVAVTDCILAQRD